MERTEKPQHEYDRLGVRAAALRHLLYEVPDLQKDDRDRYEAELKTVFLRREELIPIIAP
jgi:hypothetical protein